MAAGCKRIAESQRFEWFIIGVIVANALVLGAGTYGGIDDAVGGALEAATSSSS
ncbi:MAG: hypothetical protein H0V29_03600 [Thermoleophilaceae bacterium]|nr:hypothetical protein [Thermoleophilaceae bacterium]